MLTRKKIVVQSDALDLQGDLPWGTFPNKKPQIQVKPKHVSIPFSKLKEWIRNVKNLYQQCNICPLNCSVNRLDKEIGRCKIYEEGAYKIYADSQIEGQFLSTIVVQLFGCNFMCPFCQEFEFLNAERIILETDPSKLLNKIIHYNKGNIPAHILFAGGEPGISPLYILQTILTAKRNRIYRNTLFGLDTNLYLSPEIVRILKEAIDIFIVDIKFIDSYAIKYAHVKDYTNTILNNLSILTHEKVYLRHLVIPGLIQNNTLPVLEFIKEHFQELPLTLVITYQPPISRSVGELGRNLQKNEINEVISYARKLKLNYTISQI